MTIQKLHKILGDLIEHGFGRNPVCVGKDSFRHPLEAEGCTILEAKDWFHERVQNADDDGGSKFRKDGSASERLLFVLLGEKRANPCPTETHCDCEKD